VTALQPRPTDTNSFERAEMMDTTVAGKDKDDPAEVARQGFEAMMAGEHRVVLPEQAKARQHAKQTEPRKKK
jgi:short-subunit dehydrogenase